MKRIDCVAQVFHRASRAVADDHPRPIAAEQAVVEGQFDALLALIVRVGETHHVRRGFALRVAALVLAQFGHALDLQGLDLLPQGHIHMAAQPHKAAVLIGHAALQLRQRHLQGLRQGFELLGAGLELLGVGPDRGHGHTAGQGGAVAVQDAPTAGRQGHGVRVALLAFELIEVGANDLDVDRAPNQHAGAQATQRHEKVPAPQRRLGGQQRAVAVHHAPRAGPLHSGLLEGIPGHQRCPPGVSSAPDAGALGRRGTSLTYCVT